MSKKYCSHCGQKVEVEASYCSYCGTNLTGKDRQSSSAPAIRDGAPALPNEISPNRVHSGFGIASLVLGVITAALQFTAILGAGFAVGGSDAGASNSVLAVIGMLICGGISFHVLGLVLGIIGLAQPERKKVFPILGTAINTISLLAVIVLIIIGNSIPG